jgi:hypothetical protein
MDLREKIHSLWESFFPSSIYLILFVLVGASYFDVIGVVKSFDLVPLTASELREGQTYELLKELELIKLAPLVAIFLLAFTIYIFDRAVSAVGNFVPPFPTWHGNPSRYAPEYLTAEMLRLLPNRSNPSSLDYEAEVLIDGAKAKGLVLPDNSLEYRAQNFSRAARMATYGKAGVLWLVVLFFLAMVNGRPLLLSLTYTAIYSLIFIAIISIGFMRETAAIIASSEEKIRVAVDLLRIDADAADKLNANYERAQELQVKLAETQMRAPRMLFLSWKFRFDHFSLIAATTGIRLNRKQVIREDNKKGG